MKLILRLLSLVGLSIGLSWLGVAIFIYSYMPPDPFPQATTVIVLSGPGGEVPGTAGETRERVEAGVFAMESANALRIVMSGGGDLPDGGSHARHMANHALTLGVPDDRILIEPNSGSTLQNAWFSKDFERVNPEMPVIIVTHRYHLPRAWASFRWAGFREPVLIAPDDGPVTLSEPVLMEGIKWPFNVARATLAWIAMAAGAPDDEVLVWLQ